jgi:hypothetical protein
MNFQGQVSDKGVMNLTMRETGAESSLFQGKKRSEFDFSFLGIDRASRNLRTALKASFGVLREMPTVHWRKRQAEQSDIGRKRSSMSVSASCDI